MKYILFLFYMPGICRGGYYKIKIIKKRNMKIKSKICTLIWGCLKEVNVPDYCVNVKDDVECFHFYFFVLWLYVKINVYKYNCI